MYIYNIYIRSVYIYIYSGFNKNAPSTSDVGEGCRSKVYVCVWVCVVRKTDPYKTERKLAGR